MSAAEVEMFRKRYGLETGPATPETAAPPPPDPNAPVDPNAPPTDTPAVVLTTSANTNEIGRASWWGRVLKDVFFSVVGV